jgi:hypothetical protein
VHLEHAARIRGRYGVVWDAVDVPDDPARGAMGPQVRLEHVPEERDPIAAVRRPLAVIAVDATGPTGRDRCTFPECGIVR